MKIKSFVWNVIVPMFGYLFRSPNIIPVIYYHNIVDNGQGQTLMQTDIDVFKEHMKYLHNEGYRTLLFNDLPENMMKEKNDKCILITFDDGFISNYEIAFPIVKEYGLKINIFMVCDYINKDGYMTKTQIKEMYDSGIVGFGCHTLSHCDSRKVVNQRDFYREFEESKKELETLLGTKVNDFCFPFGYYDKVIIDQICSKGLYKHLYTSNYIKPTMINDSCVCGRIGIDTSWDKRMFSKQIKGLYRILYYYSKVRIGIPSIK